MNEPIKVIERDNSDSIHQDYEYYLGQEGIYTVLFGHRPKGYWKADYIWKALLKEYGHERKEK